MGITPLMAYLQQGQEPPPNPWKQIALVILKILAIGALCIVSLLLLILLARLGWTCVIWIIDLQKEMMMESFR